MLVSVIVKTRDEAPRLRLTLASLGCQTVRLVEPGSRVEVEDLAAEVVVVDDASADSTPALLSEEASRMPLRVVRPESSLGRAGAANAGARASGGDVLLFLDGDTLAAPDLVERHARLHKERRAYGRGENRNLRCTRFFADPETGTPQPWAEEAVLKLGPDLARGLVTRAQVVGDFTSIDARSQPGLYPGVGPRRLFEVEWDALTRHPDLDVLWMAAAGHNASLRRADFDASGGFDERLTLNEHRELALRLGRVGVPVRPVVGARTYHLTHRVGWRDPLDDADWERVFFAEHPEPAVALMSVFWLGVSGDPGIPEAGRIVSLPAMEAAARGVVGFDHLALRLSHPRLRPLPATPTREDSLGSESPP